MSQKKKSDLWKELVEEAREPDEDEVLDAAAEAEIEAASNVSVEQAEKELREAGFDVAAERAKAEAFLVALERGTLDVAPASAPVPRIEALAGDPPSSAAVGAVPQAPAPLVIDRKRRRPVVFWIAAAATATVVAGALYAAIGRAPEPAPAPLPPPSPPSAAPSASVPPSNVAVATDLRRRAAAACGAEVWDACVDDLDRARALDPAGDEAPAVKQLRERATTGSRKNPR